MALLAACFHAIAFLFNLFCRLHTYRFYLPELCSLQEQALFWKRQANKNVRFGAEFSARQCFNLALQCAPEQAVEIKRECFDALADICFEKEEFAECIEHGEKGYFVKPVENKVGCLHFSQWFLSCKHFAFGH